MEDKGPRTRQASRNTRRVCHPMPTNVHRTHTPGHSLAGHTLYIIPLQYMCIPHMPGHGHTELFTHVHQCHTAYTPTCHTTCPPHVHTNDTHNVHHMYTTCPPMSTACTPHVHQFPPHVHPMSTNVHRMFTQCPHCPHAWTTWTWGPHVVPLVDM